MLPNLTFRHAAPHDEPVLRDMLYHAVFVPPGAAAPDGSVVAQPALACYVRGWGRHGDAGIVALSAGREPIGAT